MKKRVLAILLAGAMMASMTACSTYETSSTPSESTASTESSSTEESAEVSGTSDDFTMIYNGIVTMNPIMSQSSNDVNVFYLCQIQLVRYDGTEVYCDAAESYDVNDDATVYTFHLRDGLTYSDGEPLTAEDFAYSAYCLLAPEVGSPASEGWYCIKNASAFNAGECTWEDVGVKVIDEKTIEFTMEYPLATFDKTIAAKGLYPLRQDFVESVGYDNLGSSVDTMLFSGPYVITEWVLESSMELVKNDTYWDAENSFPTKNLHFVEVKDANTRAAMFENGEVDAIEQLAATYFDYFDEYLYSYSGGGSMFLWCNENDSSEDADDAEHALMSNVNFRNALSYAINRTGTVAQVNKNYVATSRLTDANFAGVNGGAFVDEYPVESAPLEGDTAKALEYLELAMEELGYSDVSELPALNMVTWDTQEQKDLCESLIDQWKQTLGLTNIQLEQYQIGTAIGKFFDLSYDIFVITWEADVVPTDRMASMATGGECNAGIWSDPAYDELVAAAVVEPDPEAQAELVQQAEQVFIDDAAIIPLYMTGQTSAVQSYVDGFSIAAVTSGYHFKNLVVNAH